MRSPAFLMSRYLAFDLGAESGRAILGTLESGRLTLEELHRFPNTPVRVHSALYWDTLRLWHEMQQGLAVAGRERRLKLDGIGVDTWGVDFALLGADGALIENPRHYRDARTNGMLEAVFNVVPREEIFAQTGIQLMQINTLYQLYAMRLAGSPALANARTLLMTPDLFNYWLTGVAKSELTIASTSQCYNPRLGGWATDLFDRLGLPKTILPEIVCAGTRLGSLLPAVAEAAGLEHDIRVRHWLPRYGLGRGGGSGGGRQLVLHQLRDVVADGSGTGRAGDRRALACALNLTNEMGAGGKTRLLKNIAGLWLLQECRRAWALARLRVQLRNSGHDGRFRAAVCGDYRSRCVSRAGRHAGENLPRIANRQDRQAPGSPASVARTIFESLALRYRQVLESLETLLGRKLEIIHIVGGGSRNRLLNQFVADATGRTVIAGTSRRLRPWEIF